MKTEFHERECPQITKTLSLLAGLILVCLVITSPCRGQDEDDVNMHLNIPVTWHFHCTPERLLFPPVSEGSTAVTPEPVIINISSNFPNLQIECTSNSPTGNLVSSKAQGEEQLQTWYAIIPEDRPIPEVDDPRWIPGAMLVENPYDLHETGVIKLSVYGKVETTGTSPGLYRDVLTIAVKSNKKSSLSSIKINCEVKD